MFYGIKYHRGTYVAIPIECYIQDYTSKGYLTIYSQKEPADAYCTIMNIPNPKQSQKYIWDVCLDNGEQCEDYSEDRFIIVAETKTEAIEEAVKIWVKYRHYSPENRGATVMIESDNGFKIGIL